MISTVTTTTTAVTTAQIMSYSVIAVISLIVFLALKEMMRSEAGKRPSMRAFLSGANVAIIPLLMVFMVVVAFKIMSIG